jgi:putative tryptophan/tyrosine transport system substrate-binding protein
MKRREFITLLGGAAALLAIPQPLAGGGGPRLPCRILDLRPARGGNAHRFFRRMRLFGFNKGRNLAVVAGEFGLRNEQLAEAAAALVKSAPDAIVSAGPLATRAAQDATKTIPILATSDDMVADGLVPSLRRPGGNTTGVSLLAYELDGKRQNILMEAVPGVRRIAALADPNVSAPEHIQALKDAARARGVELSIFSARTPEEITPAMNEAHASGTQALNVLATPLFFFNRHTVIVHAAALRLPAVYQWPEMAEEGGSAGSSVGPAARQGAARRHA